MTFDPDQLLAWVLGFFWPFVRVAAMLIVVPVIGARTLPMRVRLMLALALTWAVQPLIGPVPTVDPLSPAGVLIVLNQVLIGVAMGFAWQVAFTTVMVAGQMIGMSMGLGFAQVVDPQNGVQVPVIGQLYFLLGALIFLALDGHLLLVELIARSFIALPLDATGFRPELLKAFVVWSGLIYSEGMRLALPMVTAILLTNLTLGVATRAAPQMNVFALGFAITILLGFATIMFSLPNFGPFFRHLLSRAMEMAGALAGL